MSNNTVLHEFFKAHYLHMSCSNVMNIPYALRCAYVKQTKNCLNYEGFINYLVFVECGKNSRRNEIFCCIGLGLLIFYYLLCMAIVADQFYSPALKATANKLHMSEHLAGVTLLAFGNSTSDLIAYMKSSGISTLFTYMVSNAIFITLISGGLVCILCPTHLLQFETLRTMLFFVLSVMITEFALSDNEAGVIILYLVYLTLTIVEGLFKKSESVVILEKRTSKGSSMLFSRNTNLGFKGKLDSSKDFDRGGDRGSVNVEAKRCADFRAANTKNEYLLDVFLESIQPIDEDSWRSAGCFVRVALIILSPLMLFFLLLIPMVNMASRRHGWSKLLNCLQVVVTPLYASFVLLYQFTSYFPLQLFITIPLAIFIFKKTRNDVPPRHHFFFVFIGATGSIIMLYIFSTEMNEILKVFGLVFGLSNSFIAATISVWGSSICTIVINVILAVHGYAAMAFTASYAGPFFNFMIAMGILPVYKILTASRRTLFLDNNFTLLAYVFLMISLLSAICWLLLFNFVGRRSVGIYNIMIYAIYVLYCVLCEKQIIHSYAKDLTFDVV